MIVFLQKKQKLKFFQKTKIIYRKIINLFLQNLQKRNFIQKTKKNTKRLKEFVIMGTFCFDDSFVFSF